MNLGSNVSIPLWLLYEDEIEGWRAAPAPLARQWLAEQNFKAEKHRVRAVAGCRRRHRRAPRPASASGWESYRCGTRRD